MLFSSYKTCLILALTFIATGCATRAAFIQDTSLTQSNSANIIIYRTRTWYHSGNPEKPFVYVDNKEIGKFGVGEALTIKLTTGEHRFSIRQPFFFQPFLETESLVALIKAGETYYLRYSEEFGGIIPLPGAPSINSTGFDIVPAAVGEARQ